MPDQRKRRFKNRLQFDGEDGTREKLEQVAKEEKRTVPALMRMLINAALKIWKSGSEGTYLKLIAKIHQLDGEELLDIAIRAIDQYKSQRSNSVSAFIEGWDLDKLQDISSIPIERLKELLVEGRQLTPDEASGLLRAGIDPDILARLAEKEGVPNGK